MVALLCFLLLPVLVFGPGWFWFWFWIIGGSVVIFLAGLLFVKHLDRESGY